MTLPAANARSWRIRPRLAWRRPGPPGLGVLLAAWLATIALIVGLGWRVAVAEAQGQANARAQAQRIERGLGDTEAFLRDARARVLLTAEAAASTSGLSDAVGAKNASRTLQLVEARHKSVSVPLLAVVDGAGQVLAADPATNLPLADAGPVRRALQGQSTVGAYDGGGSLAMLAASPVRQGDRTVGAIVALQPIDDQLMDSAERVSGLSGAILVQNRPVAATRLIRARDSLAREQPVALTPAAAGGPGRLTVGGETFSVASQALPSLGSGRPATLVVGEPDASGAPPITSWRFWLDWGSPIVAALAAGLLGWLVGRRLAGEVLGLRDGRRVESGLVGREVAELADFLDEERASACARESDLRAQNERLRRVFDAVQDGVIVSGPDRAVVLANEAAQRMLGLAGRGADGEVLAMLPPLGRAEFRANQRVLRSYSTPLGDTSEADGAVTVLHDATEERESERLKSEFLSVVSHELQTPLAAISGAADLLLEGEPGPLTAEQTRFLNAIRRNGQRLTSLVSDLLDVSRLEAGRVELDRQPVDLGMLARSGVRSMANLFEQRSQTVTVKVAEGVPPALADRRRIEQILANLLANAGQYTPPGSHVEVGVTTGRDLSGADQVILTVRDDGPGLTPADQSRVFDEFFRGANASARRDRGSGLGLSIVRSLAELHGGRAWVESAPGQGACFSVALPIATAEDV